METKHTPTPWRVEYKPASTYIFSNEPNFLLLSMSYTQTDKTTIANAKRIVECVNACEGMPSSILTSTSRKNHAFFEAIEFELKYNELKEVIEDMIKHLDEGIVLTLRKDSILVEALRNTINQ